MYGLILDLSHTQGNGVNDARSLSSLTYMRVDNVIQNVLQTGKGSLLAKIDIESAFCNIPAYPQACHLLGMLWDGYLFVYTTLPFGLCSTPEIFNSITDGGL